MSIGIAGIFYFFSMLNTTYMAIKKKLLLFLLNFNIFLYIFVYNSEEFNFLSNLSKFKKKIEIKIF